MSWSDRRCLILGLACLPLASCGFAPAHGPGGSAAALRGRVRADDPTDPDGFAFVARIEDRLGRPVAPVFRLSHTIETRSDTLVGTDDLRASRAQIVGTVRYELTGGDGARLAAGRVDNFVGYSLTSTPLANRAAGEDARRRLMVLLADAVVTRLLALDLADRP